MDAVILAAGRGERLRDLTPRFHKPLLPIDGVPLVCRAVDLATAAGCDPVVVVAPANAEAISGALGTREALLIVQREPLGPGDALLTGLRACRHDEIMVLLSDNVMTFDDVINVKTGAFGDEGFGSVGVKLIDRREAHRFTRLENDEWTEKTPVLNLYGDPIKCWVGPFVGLRKMMIDRLITCERHSSGELLIGPHLDYFMNWRNLVPVDSYDVGTLESYPKGGTTK